MADDYASGRPSPQRTWLITGCSGGLGRALAEAVLARGHRVVATGRSLETLRTLTDAWADLALPMEINLGDHASIERVVDAGSERFGGIDVLVNNAGYGYRAAVEEGEQAAVSALFTTNFLGPAGLISAVLPQMRARRRGAIVNISSSGTFTTAAGSGYYVASKAALEALSGSLRHEVEPLGISVTVVIPGELRTQFAGLSLTQSRGSIADYAATAGLRRIEHDTVHGTQSGDPHRAASRIVAAVEHHNPPLRLLLGDDAVDQFEAWSTRVAREVADWEQVSRSIALPDSTT